MLAKIKLQPGINRDTTNYTNSGGWFDSDFIRFRNGLPEKIGGWTKVYANQVPLIGKCRKLYNWSSLIGTQYLACPTNIKFYVDNSSDILDITPLRRSVGLGVNPIATTNASGSIIVTDVNHGAVIGDYITIDGATAFNGMTTGQLNSEFVVANVINANAYSVLTTGTANASSSGGGSNVSVEYQFHTGTSTSVAFTGWGAGPWGGISGSYGWGFGPTTTITTYYSGLWSVDNYGEDMVACPRNLTNGYPLSGTPIATSNGSNVVTVTQVSHGFATGMAVIIGGVTVNIGGIPANQINGTHTITVSNANAYTFVAASNATSSLSGGVGASVYTSSLIYWDITDTTLPAVSFSSLGSAYAKSYMPYVATQILVSDQNRQVIAFGCNPFDTMQAQDKMVIRWSDSTDPTNWDSATATNTSGEQRLSAGSYIVSAIQNREEILVWTDAALFSMTYVGAPYGYGFNLVGANFDILGPNSVIVTGSVAYWMGTKNFYTYDGKIQPMPCTVRDYVFNDLSTDNGDKVYCSSDSANNEVIWFYPSSSQPNGNPASPEVDRYVVYNYLENAWYYGSMARTAWLDRQQHPYPRAVSPDGYLYDQESGFDDGSTTPAAPINAYIQSSPIEIEEGDSFLFINRIIPDLTFRDSTTSAGNQPIVNFTIRPQDYPGSEIGVGDERQVQRNASATLKVDRFTNQVFTRLRARSVALRVDSDTTGVAWRLGTPRFEMRKDGKK